MQGLIAVTVIPMLIGSATGMWLSFAIDKGPMMMAAPMPVLILIMYQLITSK